MPTPPHAPVDRSSLCHELTTALTVISVRSQLLRRQLGRGHVAANGADAQAHPGQPDAPTAPCRRRGGPRERGMEPPRGPG
jgi:hypothetical protein